MEIKTYKEGNNLHIVFKESDLSEREELELLDFLQSAFGDRLKKDEPKITYARYKDLTATEILEKDGDMGFANLMYIIINRKIPSLTPEEATDVVEVVEGYFTKRVRSFGDPEEYAQKAPDKDVEDFFRYFSDEIMPADEKALLRETGCSDMNAFRENVPITFKRSAMAKILKEMQGRLRP